MNPLLDLILAQCKIVINGMGITSVPPNNVHAQHVVDYSADRHGSPGILIALTPGVAPTYRKTVNGAFIDEGFPLSIVLYAAANFRPQGTDKLAANVNWREEARGKLMDRFYSAYPLAADSWPTQVKRFIGTGQNLVDTTAYDVAGLLATQVNFIAYTRRAKT